MENDNKVFKSNSNYIKHVAQGRDHQYWSLTKTNLNSEKSFGIGTKFWKNIMSENNKLFDKIFNCNKK